MTEFINQDQLETVAQSELNTVEASLSSLDMVADLVEQGADEKLDASDLEMLLDEVEDVYVDSVLVVRKAVENLLDESTLHPFVNYVRKKIALSFAVLNSKTVELSNSLEGSFLALDIPRYVSEHLLLGVRIAREQHAQGSPTDLSVLQNQYLKLQRLDLIRLDSRLQTKVEDFPDSVPVLSTTSTAVESHPELKKTEPRMATIAKLSGDELSGIQLLAETGDENAEISWLQEDTLLKLIQATEVSLGQEVKDISRYRTKIQDLKNYVREGLDDVYLMQSDPEKYIQDTFAIDKNRLEEIDKVLDRLLEGDTQVFADWKETIATFKVYGTESAGENLADFIKRVNDKLAKGDDLTTSEKQDLRNAEAYLKAVQKNIPIVVYTVENSDYEKKLQEDKQAFLQDLIDKSQRLLKDSTEKAPNLEQLNLTEPQRKALIAYNAILAPTVEGLPYVTNENYQELVEQLQNMHPREFMGQLIATIMKKYQHEIDMNTGSEGTGYPMVVGKSHLLDGEMLTGTEVLDDDEQTFEFFITNFPWRILFKEPMTNQESRGLSGFMKDKLIARFVYMMNIQNLAHDLEIDEGVLQSGDNILMPHDTYVNTKESATIDDSYRYFSVQTDLSHDNPVVAKKLNEIWSSNEDGEDDLWLIPNLTHLFFSVIRRSFNESQRDGSELIQALPHKKRGKNLATLLDAAENKYIPDEIKNSPIFKEQIKVARNLAAWLAIDRMDTFYQDNEAITAKYSRLLNWGGPFGYGVKLWPLGLETGERATPSSVEMVERFVTTPDRFEKCLTRIPNYAWEELPADDYFDLMSCITDEGGFVDNAAKVRAQSIAAALDIPMPGSFEKRKTMLYRRKAGVIGLGDENRELINSDDFKKSNKEAFKQRYAIIRIDEDYRMFEGMGAGVLIIPKAWLLHAQKHGYSADYLPMSLGDVSEAMLDQSLVEPSSITSVHKQHYNQFVKNFSKAMYELSKDPNIGDIHKEVKEHVRRKEVQTGRMPFLTGMNIFFAGLGGGLVENAVRGFDVPDRDALKRIDRNLRKLISIKHIPDDWVARDPGEHDDPLNTSGFGIAKVTKIVVKYGLLRASDSGWNFPVDGKWTGEAKTLDDITEFLREASIRTVPETLLDPAIGNYEKAHGDDHPGRAADLKEIRNHLNLPVNEGVRLAVDMFDRAMHEPNKDKAKNLKKEAHNILNVELFMVIIRMYLDRFMPQSFISGEEMQVTGNVDNDYENVECYMAQKPLNFMDREFLLAFCDAVFLNLYSRSPVPKKQYSRSDILAEMEKRGIVGSREQFIVDRHAYINEFKKLDATEDVK